VNVLPPSIESATRMSSFLPADVELAYAA
jgi:hypothetical protein